MNDRLKELALAVNPKYFTVVKQKLGLMMHYHIYTKTEASTVDYIELKNELEKASMCHIKGYYGIVNPGYDRYSNSYNGDTFVHLYSVDYGKKAGA